MFFMLNEWRLCREILTLGHLQSSFYILVAKVLFIGYFIWEILLQLARKRIRYVGLMVFLCCRIPSLLTPATIVLDGKEQTAYGWLREWK